MVPKTLLMFVQNVPIPTLGHQICCKLLPYPKGEHIRHYTHPYLRVYTDLQKVPNKLHPVPNKPSNAVSVCAQRSYSYVRALILLQTAPAVGCSSLHSTNSTAYKTCTVLDSVLQWSEGSVLWPLKPWSFLKKAPSGELRIYGECSLHTVVYCSHGESL